MELSNMLSGLLNTLGTIAGTMFSLGSVGSSRQQFLEDREHTEMREDTAYQRGVEDMRKAGLNPYTIGANPSPSSSSSVGAQTVANRLQMLGYVLDLQNLSLKNKKLVNDQISDVLGMFKVK